MMVTGQKDVDMGSLVGDGPQEGTGRDPGAGRGGKHPIPNCWASSSSMMMPLAPETMCPLEGRTWRETGDFAGRRDLLWRGSPVHPSLLVSVGFQRTAGM